MCIESTTTTRCLCGRVFTSIIYTSFASCDECFDDCRCNDCLCIRIPVAYKQSVAWCEKCGNSQKTEGFLILGAVLYALILFLIMIALVSFSNAEDELRDML